MYQLYNIFYPNRGFSQIKMLIPHCEYEYSKTLSEGQQKSHLKHHSKGNEWFTDNSPYFEALKTGILKHYGGESPCIVSLIN